MNVEGDMTEEVLDQLRNGITDLMGLWYIHL
jgi:hypothetical protein